jgi:hypothetical protein
VTASTPFEKEEQLAPNLQAGQAEELARRFRLHGTEGAPEPQRRVLQHIVGLFPPPHGREILQQLARQPLQTAADVAQQLIGGAAGAHLVQLAQQLLRLGCVVGHAVAFPLAGQRQRRALRQAASGKSGA